MAKVHPAKKARFLAGCVGVAGFALTSGAILNDSLVDYEISSSLLEGPPAEAKPAGIDSDAFALQGSAAPAGPQTSESEVTTGQQPTEGQSPEEPTQTTAKQDQATQTAATVVKESDAESDAS